MRLFDRYSIGARLTSHQVREWLAMICKERGGQTEFAQMAGCSRAFVNDILLGNREPAGKVLNALGLKREVKYRIVKALEKP